MSLNYTPFKVSTITCNVDIVKNKSSSINIDLMLLFENFRIDTNIIWIQYLKDSSSLSKGIYPKKRRKTKKTITKKNRFDNQITVIYKFNDKYMPNIKVFKNGNLQITGIKDVEDTTLIANKIINEIMFIKENYKDIINEDSELGYSNFKIRMINTDFKILQDKNNFHIRRKELHKLLIGDKYNNKCSFQPNTYQGVKLEYFWNITNLKKDGNCYCCNHCFGKGTGLKTEDCKKVTVAIFESGCVLITGGVDFKQIQDAYDYICMIVKENEEIIKKSSV